MADKRDYVTKIKTFGTDGSGFTEDHAREMAAHLGSRRMALIEVTADAVTTNADGSHALALSIGLLEVIPEHLEDRARVLSRALYRSRPEVEGQALLGRASAGGGEPDADAAMADLDAVVDHDETGKETGVWNGDTSTEPAAPALASVDLDTCPHPGCILPVEHEGDHEQAERVAVPDTDASPDV